MTNEYKVIRALGVNVVRVFDEHKKEIILIGKGIGYKVQPHTIIKPQSIDNIFIMQNKEEQKRYEELLDSVSADLIDVADDIILYIQSKANKKLNEHIHVALTDHLSFLVKRCKLGIPIENPFQNETEVLYPNSVKIAKQVIHILSQRLNINIPDGEVGFIAMHIDSAISNEPMGEMHSTNILIAKLVQVIEDSYLIQINKNSLNYVRLITHLRFAIKRIKNNEQVRESEEIEHLLKQKFPKCYSLSWKLVKIMQKDLNTPVDDAEVIYLALHLYRFTNKKDLYCQP